MLVRLGRLGRVGNTAARKLLAIGTPVADFTIASDADWDAIPTALWTNGGTIAVQPGTYSYKAVSGRNPTAPLKFIGAVPATTQIGTTGQRVENTTQKAHFSGGFLFNNCSNLWFQDLEISHTVYAGSPRALVAYMGSCGNFDWSRCDLHHSYRGQGQKYDPSATYPEFSGFLTTVVGGVITAIERSETFVGDLLDPGTYDFVPIGSGSGLVASFTVANTTLNGITGNHITAINFTPGGGNGGSGFPSSHPASILTFTRKDTQKHFGLGAPYAFQTSGGSFFGVMSYHENVMRDMSQGIKHPPSMGAGAATIVNFNSFYRMYSDYVSFIAGSSSNVTFSGNFGTQPFSKVNDYANPHSDWYQEGLNNSTQSAYNRTIVGNVFIDGKNANGDPVRGSVQGLFISDIAPPGAYDTMEIVGNIVASKGGNAIAISNTRATRIMNNVGTVYDPTLSGNTAAITTGATTELGTAMWNNIAESFTPLASDVFFSNLTGSSASRAAYHQSYFAGGGGTLPTTKDEAIAYFRSRPGSGYESKGIGSAGYNIVNFATATINRENDLGFVRFGAVTGQALGSVSTSNWSAILGGLSTQDISISAGGEYQIADDRSGTNAGSWTSAAGTVGRGKYVRVRRTNSSSNSTTTSVTLTVGNTQASFSTTTLSTASFSRVAFDATDVLARASGPFTPGTNQRYVNFAFRAKFPPNTKKPPGQVYIFGAANNVGGLFNLSMLTTGAPRLAVTFTSGNLAINVTGLTGDMLYDGNVHEIFISIDTEAASYTEGVQLFIDGVNRLNGAGTWNGGTGVRLASSTQPTGQFLVGGLLPNTGRMDGFEVDYFYLDFGPRIDFSLAENRSKFLIDNIGTNGTGPSGSAPFMYLTGPASEWNDPAGINRGYGGKLTMVTGASVTNVSG